MLLPTPFINLYYRCLERMNRPNGQKCLAKTIWDTTNLEIEGLKCDYWPRLRIEFCKFGSKTGLNWGIQTDILTEHGECPILRQARFTEPLPENHVTDFGVKSDPKNIHYLAHNSLFCYT